MTTQEKLAHVFVILGVGLLGAGLWLMFPPLAPLVLGMLFIGAGLYPYMRK